MKQLRIGVIGLGNIGQYHASKLASGDIQHAVLSAVTDIRPGFTKTWCAEHAPNTQSFEDAGAMFDAGACDAVIVATPPPLHPPQAIQAFEQDLHVLIEKPAGICAREIRIMNAVAEASGKVFSIQFPNRFHPAFQKAKSLIMAGELGTIRRTQWTTTRWYRTQDYYNSSDWRGTWKGEGGGVLVNQCPHDLDIWVWLCGMPTRLRAFCRFGQWHDIEVEDEVTAYLEYPSGATGVFICSTGEYPGTNRLEIVGDCGTLTITNNQELEFHKLSESLSTHCRTASGFEKPEKSLVPVSIPNTLIDNTDNVNDFVQAILKGTPLTTPGQDGLNSIELSNAMQLSTWLDSTVEVPVDADLYVEKLEERIRTSTSRKRSTTRTLNITDSWQ